METIEASSAEEQARSFGWLPKEEFKGDDKQWVEAEEFNKRGELMGSIIKEQRKNRTLEGKLTNMEQAIGELTAHNRKIAEGAKKQALKELREMKIEAINEGDGATQVEIDEKIEELVSEPEVEVVVAPTVEQTPPEMVEWLEGNEDWYNVKNPIVKGAFDGLVASMVNDDPSLKQNPAEALRLATEAIKQEFPDKFEKTPRRTRQAVMGSTNVRGRSSNDGKYSASMLNEDQRKAAQHMISNGCGLTLDEYAQQLGDIGEL